MIIPFGSGIFTTPLETAWPKGWAACFVQFNDFKVLKFLPRHTDIFIFIERNLSILCFYSFLFLIDLVLSIGHFSKKNLDFCQKLFFCMKEPDAVLRVLGQHVRTIWRSCHEAVIRWPRCNRNLPHFYKVTKIWEPCGTTPTYWRRQLTLSKFLSHISLLTPQWTATVETQYYLHNILPKCFQCNRHIGLKCKRFDLLN